MGDRHAGSVVIPSEPPRRGPALRWVIFLFVSAAMLVALAMGISNVRNMGGHGLTRRHFLDIAVALGEYAESRGHLPPAVVTPATATYARTDAQRQEPGRPLYSWRLEILYYIGSWHESWDPLRPWDDPANNELVELSAVYDYGPLPPIADPKSFSETRVLAITGPGTAFGDGEAKPLAIADLSPGTILVVEVRSSGVPWPAPGDFDIRTMPRTINAPDGKGISSRYAGGFHVIFADQRVWLLSDKIPFETLSKFFTVAEAAKHDREALLGPFALDRGHW